MKHLSTVYVSSLHEYREDDAERPYLSSSGLERLKREESARVRAQVVALAAGR